MECVLRDPLARIPSTLLGEFYAHQLRHRRRFLLLINVLGQLAFLTYGWADQLVIADQALASWILRVGYVAMMVVPTYLVFYRLQNVLLMDVLLPVSIVGAAGIWFWLLAQSTDPHTAVYQYASLIFIVLANLGIQVSFVAALMLSVGISLVVGVGVLNVTKANMHDVLIFTLVYYPVFFFSLFISWSNTVSRRKEFAQATLNEQAKRSLEAGNRVLDQLAHTDALTGLDNRRQFEKLVRYELARSARTHQPACMMLFDIDHFKQINDTRGHDVGDLALKSMAEVARMQIREQDAIARYGGDEFAVLLTNTSLEAAMVVAERVRRSIEVCTLQLPTGDTLRMTTSIGVVGFGPTTRRLEDLVSLADRALYLAKKGGRNQVVRQDEPETVT